MCRKNQLKQLIRQPFLMLVQLAFYLRDSGAVMGEEYSLNIYDSFQFI